jgi:probable F420-dependent oxidoreductase
MDIGLAILPTDRSALPAELARAAEERGLESLFFGEHTHIPSRRQSPYPLGDELPDEYRRTLDPFVALAAVATATTRLRFGTCICLIAQRDPIIAAKDVATLDVLSGGRVELGVGDGWNVEEAADHGVDWSTRRRRVREHVLAMKSLWRDDVASFHGQMVDFDEVWMWPKPVQRPHPPVIVGASPGPRTFEAIVEWADGWFPVPFFGHQPDDVKVLAAKAEEAGRDPATVTVHVNGVLPDVASAEPWAAVGAQRVLVPLPSEPLDTLLPILDAAAALVPYFAGS